MKQDTNATIVAVDTTMQKKQNSATQIKRMTYDWFPEHKRTGGYSFYLCNGCEYDFRTWVI